MAAGERSSFYDHAGSNGVRQRSPTHDAEHGGRQGIGRARSRDRGVAGDSDAARVCGKISIGTYNTVSLREQRGCCSSIISWGREGGGVGAEGLREGRLGDGAPNRLGTPAHAGGIGRPEIRAFLAAWKISSLAFAASGARRELPALNGWD
uniref:Uncharacterized protein n=1 Tax=Ananas comosus var. bracteatus TaxID=296719 RepID=A0A6V7QVW2_ANACO